MARTTEGIKASEVLNRLHRLYISTDTSVNLLEAHAETDGARALCEKNKIVARAYLWASYTIEKELGLYKGTWEDFRVHDYNV
jgi:hypothetical protein